MVQKLSLFSATAVQFGEASTAKRRASALMDCHKFREEGYFTDSCCFLSLSLLCPGPESDPPDRGVWVGLLQTRDCTVQATEICISFISPILILLTFSMVGCHKLQNQENLHMHSNYFFRLFYQIKDLAALKHLIRNNSIDTCY